jgi:hypothetical protein
MKEKGLGLANESQIRHFFVALASVWGDKLSRLELPLSTHRNCWMALTTRSSDITVDPLKHLILIRLLFGNVQCFFKSVEGVIRQGLLSPREQRLVKLRERLDEYLGQPAQASRVGFINFDIRAYNALRKQDRQWMEQRFQEAGVERRSCFERPAWKIGMERHRACLTQYLATSKRPSRTDFRRFAQTAYMWLVRSDREWMDKQFENAGAIKWSGCGQYQKKG